MPGFWLTLEHQAGAGRLASIDRIQDDLEKGNDALADWAKAHEDVFLSTDSDGVLARYAELMQWVHGQDGLQDAAKFAYASAEDGWLVAYASAKRWVVVTHEQPSPYARRRVPIPTVCEAAGVRFVNLFEMLRGLGVKLA